jgi:hypothetical protein
MSKSIDEIMCEFDFEKVHKCMVLIGWEWAVPMHVPSIDELQMEAVRLLIAAYNRKWECFTIECGGFRVVKNYNGLVLSFILEEA